MRLGPVGSRRLRLVAVLSMGGLSLSACSPTSSSFAAAHAPTGAPTVIVALGGDDSAGQDLSQPDYQEWTQILYRAAFSARSTLYDLSVSGGTTIYDVTTGELQDAVGLHPNIVAMSVGLEDLLQGTPAGEFGSQLASAIRSLRASGAEVIVADLPPVWRFPSYERCDSNPLSCGIDSDQLPGESEAGSLFAAYDHAIDAAAREGGAIVAHVDEDFTRRLADEVTATSLVASADLGLTPAGEQVVADAFEQALDRPKR